MIKPTQNQNKSIWSCPKKGFCGIHHLRISICDTAHRFNDNEERMGITELEQSKHLTKKYKKQHKIL